MTDPAPQSHALTMAALTGALIALYTGVESWMLSGVARILRRSLPTPAGRLLARDQITQLVGQAITHLDRYSPDMVYRALAAASQAGAADAGKAVEMAFNPRPSRHGQWGPPQLPPPPGSGGQASIGRGPRGYDLSVPHGVRAEAAIRADLAAGLRDVRFRLTRLPDDVYKAITPQGAGQQVLQPNVTPSYAQAQAWRELTQNGVTGFVDKSGRNWQLSAYVEMAVRTSVQRAYNAVHLERMLFLGISYFTVTDDGHPCPKCFPWQNRILTDGPMENPEVPVSSTIQIATAAGLWHPNCRHVLVPFIPGTTVLGPVREWSDADQARYDSTQKQRAIEREIRKAKQAAENAADAQVASEARADVRAAQAAMRRHLAQTGLVRRPRREQLNLTLDQYPAP